MKSGIDNAYLAPIWILKVDRVLYEEKYHLKVYFFANVEGLDIEQLRFKFKYEDKEVELKADKFVKAESYPQDPVFGCVLHLPEDYPDCDYDLLFTGLFTGRRYEDYTDYERGQLYFNVYIPSEKVKFLQHNLSRYWQHPRVGKTYWQCACGHHNLLKNTYCIDCLCPKDIIDTYLEKGEDLMFMELFQRKVPLAYNRTLSFEATLDHYVKMIVRDYGLEEAFVRDHLNIDLAKQSHADGEVLDQERLAKLKLDDQKLSKWRLWFIAVFIALVLFFGIVIPYGSKFYAYANGMANLWKQDYRTALAWFEDVEGFLNVNAQMDETNYQWAIQEFELRPGDAILRLEQLHDLKYKDVEVVYDRFVIAHAEDLFAKQMYFEASEYFVKLKDSTSVARYHEALYQHLHSLSVLDVEDKRIESILVILMKANYKDSYQIYNERHYQAALTYLERGSFKESISLLERILSYKDVQKVYEKTSYLYALELFEKKQFDLAIEYFLRSPQQADVNDYLMESRYQQGLKLMKDREHYLALEQFKMIPGYKETDRYFEELADLVFAWTAQIQINSDPENLMSRKSISREKPVYIHFMLFNPDERAKTIPWFKYQFPNGEIVEESFETEVMNGQGEWVGWEEGIYVDPQYGSLGTLRVWIYDSVTGRLIGTQSVEITK